MTPLELACGIVLGFEPPEPWPPDSAALTPVAALEAALLPALRNPPCLVSFSGGRDSSLVLAAATRLARREGLPDPVPATNRAMDAPAAEETSWQELVVGALRLQDWVRCCHTDELDAVGPYAQRMLREHGLVWPFNAHFHLPLIDAARGGSLLTGIGGDELFGAVRRTRLTAVRTLQIRPRRRDAARAALALAPAGLRTRVLERRLPIDFPWLRPGAARAAMRALAAVSAREPHSLRSRVPWYRALRYLRVSLSSLDAPARAGDVQIVHPLADRELWRAVEVAAAPHGFEDRTAGMRRAFGDLLPPELLAREDKATFDDVFFTGHARAFADAWTGAGVPGALVDVESLRRHWRSDSPRPQSFSLLQAAWLASAGDRAEQPVGGLGESRPALRPA